MAKERVYALAKKYGVENAEVISALAEKGLEVKAQSSVEDEYFAFLDSKFGGAKAADDTAKKEAKEEKKAEKEESDKQEEKKPRVIITSRGVVKTGEKSSGERKKKRKHKSSSEHKHHSGEHKSHRKSSSSKSKSSKSKTKPEEEEVIKNVEETVVETPVTTPEQTETVEAKVVETKEEKEAFKPEKPKKSGRRITGPISDGPKGGVIKKADPADKPAKKNVKNKNNKPQKPNKDKSNDSRDDSKKKPYKKGMEFRNEAGESSKGGKGRKKNNKKRNDNGRDRRYEDGPSGKNARDFSKKTLTKPKKKEEKKEEIKIIQVPETITIGELANRMKMTASDLIKKLFLEGKMVTVNTEVTFDDAEEIAMGFDIMCEMEEKVDIIEELLKEEEEDESLMEKRPPVVCVMGHVDHGKTSLLDAIRETNVISGEAGGITQHIGASVVEINGKKITFLDTPGHEAFTSMRMRGAQSTDIAILVVAADDGVMPQTIEAINHAKAAGIEIIVAINKIDKVGANIDRVKQGLAEHEILATDWGGNIEMVPVSAHTREGIDDLLEMVLLQAEVLELKANPNREARGIIVEAKLDKGKGPVATALIQKGTLRIGEHVAAGAHYGKVRAMSDFRGNPIKVAGPSTPVEILGLNGVPNAGEVFVSTATVGEAKDFANTFIEDSKAKLMENNKFRISLDDLNSQIEAGELKELNLIVKADVQGSVEAVKESLIKLSNDEVEVKVIHGGVGNITESDVILASASNAIIIGFNVKADSLAEETARNEHVDVRLYNVIYNAIDDIERAMKGLLAPVYEEMVTGHAEIRQIFKASGVGNIAGSYVTDGTIERGCKVRITRGNDQIFEGDLASLKRYQDDVKEVKTGFECGLVFEGFDDVAEGDIVEAYVMHEVAPE